MPAMVTMDAFKTLSCEEGILPALETSHGLAYAFKEPQNCPKNTPFVLI